MKKRIITELMKCFFYSMKVTCNENKRCYLYGRILFAILVLYSSHIVFVYGYEVGVNPKDISLDLKVYEGDFKWRSKNSNIGGKARYEYTPASDGSRIFEGKFIFKDQSEGLVYQGYFKNNRQVGKWIFQSFANSLVSYVFFDEDGHPKGRFVYKLGAYYIEGTITAGILVGDYHYKDGQIEIWGTYNTEGEPVGEWKAIARVHGEYYNIKSLYSINGQRLKEWYWNEYDDSTGDTKERSMHVDDKRYHPNNLQHDAIYLIESFMIRDSSLK